MKMEIFGNVLSYWFNVFYFGEYFLVEINWFWFIFLLKIISYGNRIKWFLGYVFFFKWGFSCILRVLECFFLLFGIKFFLVFIISFFLICGIFGVIF